MGVRDHGAWRLLAAVAAGAIAVGGLALDPAAGEGTATGTVVAAPLPGDFGAIAVDGARERVLVSSPSDSSVSVFDFSAAPVARLNGIAGARALLVDGDRLYVAATTGGTVEEYDLATLGHVRTLAEGLVAPNTLAKAGGLLWTSTGSCGGSVSVVSVDPATGASRTHSLSRLGYCPHLSSSPTDPDVLFGFDAGLSPATVTKLNVSTGVPVVLPSSWVHGAASNMKQLSVAPDGASFVTASGAPYRIDTYRTSDLAASGVMYTTGPYPNAVVTTPANGGLVVAGRYSSYDADIDVFRLGDPSTRLMTHDFGSQYDTLWDRGLAVSPDGTLVFAVTGETYGSPRTAWLNVLGISGQATTTTSLTSSPNPSVPGETVWLTASVSGGTPGGTVTFYDGTTLLGTNPVDNGVSKLAVSGFTAGTHRLTASYSGDASHAASRSPVHDHVVERAQSSTVLTSSPDPSVRGEAVTFTASVKGVDPTGEVTFVSDGRSLGTVAVVGGQASVTVRDLAVGSHGVSASYSGDAANAPSTGQDTHTVTKAATATAVSASPNPVKRRASVTLAATVSVSAPGSGVAGGSVTFYVDGDAVGVATLVNGVATTMTSFRSAGTYAVTAVYAGSGDFEASTSAPYALQVRR